MQRDREVLEPLGLDVPVDEPLESRSGYEVIAGP
jgi:hypothetical protein